MFLQDKYQRILLRLNFFRGFAAAESCENQEGLIKFAIVPFGRIA